MANRANRYYPIFVGDLISAKYLKNVNAKDREWTILKCAVCIPTTVVYVLTTS